MENTKEKMNTPKNLVKVFLFGTVMFWIGMLPFLVFTKGAYVYSSDYNAQMIPFWQHVHDLYREGLPLFDWKSDLGMGTLSAYSFYNIFSPYMLMSLIFPSKVMPWAITVINGIKFGVTALNAHVYLSRYLKKKDTVFICSLLYTFSGFMVNNLVFQYIDVISLFPMVLFTFDELLYKRRSLCFSLMLVLTGFTNFFTFFSVCVFLLIYFLVKVVCREVVIDKKLFAKLAVETALGVLGTAVVLLPAFYMLQGNSRASSTIFEKNLLAYEDQGTLLRAFQSLLMPPEPGCYQGLFFSSKELNFSNLSLFIPLFGAVGVVSEMRKSRKSWYSRLITVCAVILAVPVLNSVFFLFNNQFYARWLFMPLLVMVMMTGKFIEDFDNRDIRTELKVWGISLAVFIAYAVFILVRNTDDIRDNLAVYCSMLAYAVASVLVLVYMKKKNDGIFSAHNRKKLVCAFCAAMILIDTVSQSSATMWTNAKLTETILYNDMQEVDIGDDEFYRVISESRVDGWSRFGNAVIAFGYPYFGSFNSCTPAETTAFYHRICQDREQNPMFINDTYALYSLMSVKYDLYSNPPMTGGIEIEPEHIEMKRKGFELRKAMGHYVEYENVNFIPMGFAYDYYVREEDYPEQIPENMEDLDAAESERRQLIFLKAICLTDEQIEKYGADMEKLPDELAEDTSYETYVKDCEDRRNMAAYEFTPDGNGFTSKINAPKDELVFYSVPCTQGFTASVDGVPTEIEKVFGGLCAVYVPEGEHTVRFDYETPGLRTGAVVSVISAALLAIYGIVCAGAGKIRKKKIEESQR